MLSGDKMESIKLRELIVQNQNLIYSVIHRFRSKDYDDLFQAGCIGLIKAYNNFDSRVNTKFTSYAYNYVLGEIYQHIVNNRNIHMSPANIKLSHAIVKAEDYLTSHLGRYPTDDEICSFVEIDRTKLFEIRNSISTESLDYDYDGSDLYDFVSQEKLSKDTLLDLKDAMDSLTASERALIMARYFGNYTQTELAKYYNTNQVKISREEQKILTKLKARLQ